MMYLILFFVAYIGATVTTLIQHNIFWDIMPKFIVIGGVSVAIMATSYGIARRLKRYDLVDVAWGITFIGIALASYGMQKGDRTEKDVQLLILVLVVIWGVRLSWYIFQRFRRHTTDDSRYEKLWQSWRGNRDVQVFWRIYMVQAFLALLVMIPVIHTNLLDHARWGIQTYIGVGLWAIGFIVETVADYQRQRYMQQPGNSHRVMQSGLWRYSRHPNYFGEIVLWWGIGLICFGTQFGWVGIAGPVLLTYLIVFVSGVPLAEERMAAHPDWAVYKRRTSVLLPWKPQL